MAVAPDNPTPRGALARLYLASGRKEDAERTMADARSALANDPRGYRMLGDYYVGVGDSEKALAEFSSLSQAHPGDLGVKRTYIQLLVSQNRMEDANTLNEQILKKNPEDLEASIIRGQILERDQNEGIAMRASNASKKAASRSRQHQRVRREWKSRRPSCS